MSAHRTSLLIGIGAWLVLSAPAAVAVTPDEMLADPALEARARLISQDLRCVVCPNQSIDDSNAPLARDLRVLVRERLMAGDTDSQVSAFLVARYGNFVLLKPPLQPNTLLLWLAPALIAAAALLALLRFLRRQQSLSTDMSPAAPPPAGVEDLTAQERERLRQLLGKGLNS